MVSSSSNYYCGTVNFNFTTPASPIMNKLLRLRVITSPSGVSGPCQNITNGQVEDFSIIFKQNIPLPLNLLSFTGRNEGTVNILQWSGIDERNVREYLVERSRDGKLFSPIGFMTAQNKPSVSYTFTDISAETNHLQYYRLMIIDQSGNVSFSKIVTIDAGKRSFTLDRLIRLIPAGGKLSGNIICQKQGKIEIGLFDMLGKPLVLKTITVGIGVEKLEINMADFAAGTYILTLRDESGTVITEKVVKGE